MTLEEILVIITFIYLFVALLVMRWCERNTYVLGIGWAIKRKIHCWRKNKMKNAKRRAAPGGRSPEAAKQNIARPL